jgi:hypothetical protein
MGEILQFVPADEVGMESGLMQYAELGRRVAELAYATAEGKLTRAEYLLRRATLEKSARALYEEFGI